MSATLDILTLADVLASRGGLEILQTELCSELVARGHRVGVAHREGGDLEREWSTFASALRQVPTVSFGRKLGRTIPAFARAGRVVLSLPADVVYVHHYEHLELAWVAARGGRAPIVAHFHLRGPTRLGPFGRHLIRRADRIIAVSNAVADGWVAAGAPSARVEVVHNGVDTDRFTTASAERVLTLRAARGIAADAFVVVYAGRPVRHKGLGVLLEAMELLPACLSAILVVAGPGAIDLTPGRGVLQVGALSRVEVVPLLQLADVVAVPTLEFDGCPLLVPEALACGVPVVASAVGGIPEQLTGDLTGWTVPPGDAAALAGRLSSLAGWRQAQPQLSRLCRAHALKHFSRERMVDGIENVLSAADSSRQR